MTMTQGYARMAIFWAAAILVWFDGSWALERQGDGDTIVRLPQGQWFNREDNREWIRYDHERSVVIVKKRIPGLGWTLSTWRYRADTSQHPYPIEVQLMTFLVDGKENRLAPKPGTRMRGWGARLQDDLIVSNLGAGPGRPPEHLYDGNEVYYIPQPEPAED